MHEFSYDKWEAPNCATISNGDKALICNPLFLDNNGLMNNKRCYEASEVLSYGDIVRKLDFKSIPTNHGHTWGDAVGLSNGNGMVVAGENLYYETYSGGKWTTNGDMSNIINYKSYQNVINIFTTSGPLIT